MKHDKQVSACNVDISELNLLTLEAVGLYPTCEELGAVEDIDAVWFKNGGLYYEEKHWYGHLSKSLYTHFGRDAWNNAKGLLLGVVCIGLVGFVAANGGNTATTEFGCAGAMGDLSALPSGHVNPQNVS